MRWNRTCTGAVKIGLIGALIGVCMGISLGFSGSTGYAENADYSALQLTRTYALNQDVDMNGVTSRFAWYFTTDSNWTLEKGTLNLDYSLSELLLPKDSSMTLYLNDQPFKSFMLQPKGLNERQHLIVDLPLKDIKAGTNTLSVRATARLTESLCNDENSVGNWIRLQKSSNVQLRFESNKDATGLSSYPSPFGGIAADRERPTRVMIENAKDANQLAAGMTLMAMLGGRTENPTQKLSLMTYPPLDKTSQGPEIYLGTLKGLPEALKSKFPKGEMGKWQDPKGYVDVIENLDGDGVLLAKLKDSVGKNTSLLILANDTKELMRGVKALSNTNLVHQMNQPQILIKPSVVLDSNQAAYDALLSLNDLGVGGIKFIGPYRQSASFGVNLAGKQVSALGSKMVFHFRYSENLDFDTALMTVFVNDIPIGSKRLTLKEANGDTLEVSLPKEVKNFSYDDVRISFDLQIHKRLCELKPVEMPWAYVTPDSYLYLPTEPKAISLFQDLPAPFVSNQNLSPIELVVPETLTEREISGLGKLFAWLGTDVKGNLNDVKVTFNRDWTPPGQNADRNIIVYDKANRDGAIAKVNNELWFKVDSGFTQILSNEKLQLLPEFQKYAGFIELKSLPQWHGKALLAIYSLDDMQLPVTLTHLYNQVKRSKLSGDAAVIGVNDASMSFRFQKEPEVQSTMKWTDVKKETLQMGIFVVIVALFFAVGIGITLYRNRRN